MEEDIDNTIYETYTHANNREMRRIWRVFREAFDGQ